MTRACFLVEQECDKTHVYMAMRNSVMKNQNYIATASVATMLAVMFVGAILPTPLYPLFREAFGFSAVTLTLVYAV
jgi:hypothetical protein